MDFRCGESGPRRALTRTMASVAVARTSFGCLLAASLLASGCGTIFDLTGRDPPCSGGRQIYGGMLLDIDYMEAGGLATFFFLLDLPLSFVADTLLLPITIPRELESNERSRETRGAKERRVPPAAEVTEVDGRRGDVGASQRRFGRQPR